MTLQEDRAISETETPRRSIWQILWKDLLLLATGNIGYAVGQVVFRSILIVALVPTAYGRLTLVLSIYSTLWVVASGGLPGGVARHLAIVSADEDAAATRAVFIATAWPALFGAVVMGIVSGMMLESLAAGLVGSIGLGSLVYATVTIGILRGRHRIGPAASVMPVTAVGELLPLVGLVAFGIGVTTLSAFAAFCFGNVVGLMAGVVLVWRTRPVVKARPEKSPATITSRELLGFSMWLAMSAVGIALLPLIVRFAASLDSYSEAAIADVALVIFSIPQRLGTLMAVAMTPHASRSIHLERTSFTISRREQILIVVPFVVVAVIMAATPLTTVAADAIGRPEYARCGTYLCLVMLAGPARILYGLASGILIGHGDAKFLGITVFSVTVVAAVLMFGAAVMGSPTIAFAILIPAFWAIYLLTIRRVDHLDARLARSAQ